MKKEKLKIWDYQEYNYQASYGFIPNLVSYIHEETSELRKGILIVPGGGYRAVATSEAEMVALAFFKKGYNTFVLTYTTNLLQDVPLKSQPLLDLSRTVRLIRKNYLRFRLNPNQLTVCGFSAGGHLVGSLCVHAKDVKDSVYGDISSLPNAVILSYPVVTTGQDAHEDSFKTLLGPEANDVEKDYWSIEKQVSSEFPPAFIWHTMTDQTVPVTNSLVLSESLRKVGVVHALHLFSQGGHGLSLADNTWASGAVGDDYTTAQTLCVLAYLKKEKRYEDLAFFSKGIVSLEERKQRCLLEGLQPNPEVAVWPELADNFLKEYCFNEQ